MPMVLGETVTAVRLRHPAYADSTVVPTRVLLEEAGRLQRRFALRGTQAYPGFLVQQSAIFLACNQDNLPGTVAAGTTGGLPVDDVTGDPVFGTAGAAPYYDLDDAAVQIADFVASAVTVGATTDVQLTAAGRTINGDVGLALHAVFGPGSGPDAIRVVASNTDDTWTVPNFRESVHATTIFRLIQLPGQQEDGSSVVVTQVASTTAKVGYLTKLNSAGVPYLDLTAPLIALVRQGMPLPPLDRIRKLEGTASPVNSLATEPVQFPFTSSPQFFPVPVFYGPRRSMSNRGRCAFVEGGQLHLMGDTMTWTGVRNLVLTYVPIPPLFTASRTALEQYYVLPETAYDAMVAGLAVCAARHATARGKTVPDETPEFAASFALWVKAMQGQANAMTRQPVRNR